MTEFPVLDSPRDNTEHRVVISKQGLLEAHIDETDGWCWMPMRLAAGNLGLVLEIGPYTLDGPTVAALQAAVAAYGRAADWIRAGTQ